MEIKVLVKTKSAYGREYKTIHLDDSDVRAMAEAKAKEMFAIDTAKAEEIAYEIHT